MLRRLPMTLFLCLVLAGPALAGRGGVHMKLAAGKLTVKAPAASATVAGPVKVAVTVTDARGNGKGWTLKLIAPRKLTISAVSATCVARSTCTAVSAVVAASGAIGLQTAPKTGMGVTRLMVRVAKLAGGAPVPLSFPVS